MEHIPELSYGDLTATRNALIQGDNAAVLEALAGELTGAVRCVYIDPPYNNQERYTHYDDRARSDRWLADLERVLTLLHPLLREDGSLWISIDDNEVHYLKVLADTVFGRANFVTTIVWEHRTTRENRRVFSNNHEYVLVYAKDPERFAASRNRVAPGPELLRRYRNPDDDPRGPWQSVSANVQGGHGTAGQFYELTAPNGRRHRPPKGRCWVYTRERMEAAVASNEVWFGRDGNGVPRLKRFLADAAWGVTPETLWRAEDVGTTRTAKREVLELLGSVFDTPKPEALIARVLEIASDPGDLVLDAYLGSGTTAAVAHKLGREWIGIEAGDHAVTHCAQRLRHVVDESGGGGFNFHRLRGLAAAA